GVACDRSGGGGPLTPARSAFPGAAASAPTAGSSDAPPMNDEAPRLRGFACVEPARGSVLGDGLLGHDLLRRGLGHGLGSGLLRDRRRGRTGRLRGDLAAGVAVAGVVALALGRLAIALAHRLLLEFVAVARPCTP